jgi:hypothetical protein
MTSPLHTIAEAIALVLFIAGLTVWVLAVMA